MRAVGIGATLLLAAALVAGALWLRGRGRSAAPAVAACDPGGSASLEGAVGESSMAPIRTAWYAEFLAGAYVVVLDEGASTCGDPNRDARHLGLWFPCGGVSPGVFEVRPRQEQTSCATAFASVVLERGAGGDLGTATEGSVTIDDVGACLHGRFDVRFPGGSRLRGTFDAAVCPRD
jgi:hypothetical protein